MVVLDGFDASTPRRLIRVIDPWAEGSGSGVHKVGDLTVLLATQGSILGWTLPAAPRGISDEPEIAMDSDNDGLVDFDETQRFGTDPFDADTDGDFVGDFIDVRASVFDATFGYANNPWATRLDVDGDSAAMELDADSDGDGCTDGQEDFTLNGDFEPLLNETHNFDELDKRCRAWIGRTTYETRFTSAPFTRFRATGRIRWTPAPQLIPGPPLPGFVASFVPQGEVTLDLFSVLGCRFAANPDRIAVDQTAGQMDIDYLSTPPEARGGAGTALVTSLTNCQGQTFPEVIPLIALFAGPVPLNAAEDEIKKIERIVSGPAEITIDLEYHLEAP
jgi:hypothetical protein